MNYKGSCHCGNVTFEVEGDLTGVMACNCSLCSRKGALLWFVSRDKLTVLTPEESIGTYTFNKHVIKHRFCRTCGIHSFYVPRSHPDKIDVNVRTLDGIDLTQIRPIPFDGQNWEAARAAL